MRSTPASLTFCGSCPTAALSTESSSALALDCVLLSSAEEDPPQALTPRATAVARTTALATRLLRAYGDADVISDLLNVSPLGVPRPGSRALVWCSTPSQAARSLGKQRVDMPGMP